MSKKNQQPDPLRAKAEEKLARVPAADMSSRSAEKLLHELQVHQIELEMQNENLRQAQVALEESRDRYIDLYEFAPVCYLTLTRDGMINEVNLTGAKLLGVERKKLLRRRFGSFVAPEQRDRWSRIFADMLQHKGMKSCELPLDNGEGKRLQVRLECLYRATDGASPVLHAALSDITHLREAEEAMRKSSEEIEDLYNYAPCGYHSLDKDGIICRINDTELAWLGYARDEVAGKMKWPDLLTPAGVQAFRETFPQLKKQGFVHDLEIEIIRKDGTVFIGLINATAIYDAGGNYVMSRSTVADITERKQMERQLRSLAAHLQIVREEEKTGIAREIHDDLGGTLTALKMEAYWLADELLANKETASLLEHTRLISQLTDDATNVMRRVITGLRPSILDDLGLPAALEWQAAQFHQRTGIECRVNCIGTECGENKLDRAQSINLFRIFQETLTNAARHSFASRVEVEFSCNDDEVMLSVSDNGRGMPEKHAVAPNSFGLLGITERAEQLGGWIKFGSSPNGGLSVMVGLPSRRQQKMEEA